MKILIYFIFIFLLSCSKKENEILTKNIDNIKIQKQIDLPESELLLISDLNKLQFIPNNVAGTREGDIYLSGFNELIDKWTINNESNNVDVVNIHDWKCNITNDLVLGAGGGAGKLKQNFFQCNIPGFPFVIPMDISKKYVNVTLTLNFDSIPELSIYKGDQFKFNGEIKSFNALKGFGSAYMVDMEINVTEIENISKK